jgi:protein SCO1
MKRKVYLYLGFFVVLVLAFWGVLSFVIKDFGAVKLPVLNKVHEFSFTDEAGRTFTEAKVDGKVYVTEYFFTTCTGICPKMNRNMKRIYDKFGSVSNFALLSHTSMPEVDSVPKMLAFEKKLLGQEQVANNNWHFLTGPKPDLYQMARQSYLLDDIKNKNYNEDQFIHTQFFALVDKNRRVRGVYDGLKEEEVKKLFTDVESLLKQPAEKGNFNNSAFSNNPN